MKRQELENISELTLKKLESVGTGWVKVVWLAVYILIPFWGQWLRLNEDPAATQIILGGVALLWLFIMTGRIIYLDDRLVLPVRSTILPGRMLGATTVAIWLGFIVVPVIGLLSRPGRELAALTTVYLVMGLANLLVKFNRQTAFRNWLKAASVAPREVQAIHDVRLIQGAGLYALTIQPWWLIQVELRESDCVIELLETEGESLVEVLPGKRRRKQSATMAFAVRWLERRVKQNKAANG